MVDRRNSIIIVISALKGWVPGVPSSRYKMEKKHPVKMKCWFFPLTVLRPPDGGKAEDGAMIHIFQADSCWKRYKWWDRKKEFMPAERKSLPLWFCLMSFYLPDNQTIRQSLLVFSHFYYFFLTFPLLPATSMAW